MGRQSQNAEPVVDEANYGEDVEALMFCGVRLEVGSGETEEGGGGFEAIFLEVNEGAGELD